MASMSSLDPSLSALTRKQEREELANVLAIPEIFRSTNLFRLLSFVCEKYSEGKTYSGRRWRGLRTTYREAIERQKQEG